MDNQIENTATEGQFQQGELSTLWNELANGSNTLRETLENERALRRDMEEEQRDLQEQLAEMREKEFDNFNGDDSLISEAREAGVNGVDEPSIPSIESQEPSFTNEPEFNSPVGPGQGQ